MCSASHVSKSYKTVFENSKSAYKIAFCEETYFVLEREAR